MKDFNGNLKIVDFGLASKIDEPKLSGTLAFSNVHKRNAFITNYFIKNEKD